MGGKIHRATVTQADLHYVGSITVDQDLLDAAGILEGEQVHVVDVTNGARLETYTIAGERGSGVIGINGAAAHLVAPGDLVIILSYQMGTDSEIAEHKPKVVHLDAENSIVTLGDDAAEAAPGAEGQVSGRTSQAAEPTGSLSGRLASLEAEHERTRGLIQELAEQHMAELKAQGKRTRVDLKTIVRRHSGRGAASTAELREALALITEELHQVRGESEASFDALQGNLREARRLQDMALDQVRRGRYHDAFSSIPCVTMTWEDPDGVRDGAR
ncbi:hypothetical protein GCM10009674_31330 [Nesterenkonia xinjiangensis]